MRLATVGMLTCSIWTLAMPAVIHASPPNPANCTIPSRISLVGSRQGVPDSTFGRFTVYVARLSGYPYAGAEVVVDLSAAPGTRLASSQAPNPIDVNCTAHTVRAWTNVQGLVSFTVMGSSSDAALAPGPSQARIYANNVCLGTIPVAAYDLDGQNGVGIADLSIWARDYFSNEYYGRSDYDGDGVLGIGDLSLWTAALYAGGSSSSAASSCP